jgi:hypothetical protein
MLKWKPPMGRQLAIPDKGRMVKLFKPWQFRPDLENTTLNNTAFSKWYNGMIDTTQRLRIL